MFALVWIHLLAAMVWIGGMVFLSVVLVPVLKRDGAFAQYALLFRTIAYRFRATECRVRAACCRDWPG